jgi:hypothetical protein
MCDFGLISVPAAAATATAATAATTATATAAAGFSWLAAASTAAGILGTGMSVLGGMQQSRYQAAVAKNNQRLAERQAEDALRRGDLAEDQQRQKTALILGTQRAGMAGQGTALDEGSPLDIVGDTAMVGETDALTIRSNAEREAWGYRAQAMNFGAQAALERNRAGLLGTGASLLSGGAGVLDRWSTYRRAGAL